jgi:hypothetical protein
MAMEGRDEIVVVALTKEEAMELFMRCLRSHDDDNAASTSILKKLARLVDLEWRREQIAS